MSICLASLSDRSTSTSVRRSSSPLCTKRKPPAVKVELPPRSSSLAFSRTSTLAPCSWAARAAHSAALPAPTTITSYGPASAILGPPVLRPASLRTVAAWRKASHIGRHERRRPPPHDRRGVPGLGGRAGAALGVRRLRASGDDRGHRGAF